MPCRTGIQHNELIALPHECQFPNGRSTELSENTAWKGFLLGGVSFFSLGCCAESACCGCLVFTTAKNEVLFRHGTRKAKKTLVSYGFPFQARCLFCRKQHVFLPTLAWVVLAGALDVGYVRRGGVRLTSGPGAVFGPRNWDTARIAVITTRTSPSKRAVTRSVRRLSNPDGVVLCEYALQPAAAGIPSGVRQK
jgi:hypothetical protein